MLLISLLLVFLATVGHSLSDERNKFFPVFTIEGHCILSDEKLVLQPGEEATSTEECYAVKCIKTDNGDTKAEIIHCEELDSSENNGNCKLVTSEEEQFPACCPRYECEDAVAKTVAVVKRQVRMDWNSPEAKRFYLIYISCLLHRPEIITFKKYMDNSSRDITEDMKAQIKSGQLNELTEEEEGALNAFFLCMDDLHEQIMAYHRGNHSRSGGEKKSSDKITKRNAGTDRGHSHRSQRFFLIQIVCLLNQTEILTFKKYVDESSKDVIETLKTQLKNEQMNALNEDEEGALNAYNYCAETTQSLMSKYREVEQSFH